MSLTLRVLAPDQSVFDGTAEEVILPSTTGQVGILPGHVTMLAALDTGVMRLRSGGAWSTIALMGGFAEVEADEVTVLVNAAELGSSINAASAEAAFEAAQTAAAAFEGKPASPDKVKAQQALASTRARFQASNCTGYQRQAACPGKARRQGRQSDPYSRHRCSQREEAERTRHFPFPPDRSVEKEGSRMGG